MDRAHFFDQPMGLETELLTVLFGGSPELRNRDKISFSSISKAFRQEPGTSARLKRPLSGFLVPPQKSTLLSTTTISVIAPDLADEYTDMVKGLVESVYSGVTRLHHQRLLRMKIGDALQKRKVAPHIYESREEARRALESPEW